MAFFSIVGVLFFMMFDNEHVTVGGCSPFGLASPDGDAVNLVDETPLRVAVSEEDMGVVFGVTRFVVIAVRKQSSVKAEKSLAPVWRYLSVFLRLFTAFLHIIPLGLQWYV